MDTEMKEPDVPERTGMNETKETSTRTQLAASVMINLKEQPVLPNVPANEEKHTTTDGTDSPKPDMEEAKEGAPIDITNAQEESKLAADAPMETDVDSSPTTIPDGNKATVTPARPEQAAAAALLLQASEAMNASEHQQYNHQHHDEGNDQFYCAPHPEDILVHEGVIRQSCGRFEVLLEKYRADYRATSSEEEKEALVTNMQQQIEQQIPDARFLESTSNKTGWQVLKAEYVAEAIQDALEQHDDAKKPADHNHEDDNTKSGTESDEIKKNDHNVAPEFKDTAELSSEVEEGVASPQDYRLSDVIVIGGKIADGTDHEGNQRLIELIRIWGGIYASAPYPEKDEVAVKVLKTVTEFSHPPGRFLQPQWKTGKWIFFSPKEAKNAIHRALEFSAAPRLTLPYATPREQEEPSSATRPSHHKQDHHVGVEVPTNPVEVPLPKRQNKKRRRFGAKKPPPIPAPPVPVPTPSQAGDVSVDTSMESGRSFSSPANEEGSSPANEQSQSLQDGENGPGIANASIHDVLRGRGGIINQHVGNKLFRQDIKNNHVAYSLAAGKGAKHIIVNNVLNAVKSRGGRFLHPHPTLPACWTESTWEEAKRKTSQALREGASEVRRQMGVDSVSIKLAAKANKQKPSKVVGKKRPFPNNEEDESKFNSDAEEVGPVVPDEIASLETAAAGIVELCQPPSSTEITSNGFVLANKPDPKAKKNCASLPSAFLSGGSGGGVEPEPNDVLSGRGGRVNSHPGNLCYRKHILENRVAYSLATSEAEKAGLIHHVIEQIRNQNPPGRFLFRDYKKQQWVEAPEERWIRKTSQALREGAPNIRLAYGGDSSKLRVRRTTTRRIETLADLTEFASGSSAPATTNKNLRVGLPVGSQPATTDNADNPSSVLEAAELLGGLGQAVSKEAVEASL